MPYKNDDDIIQELPAIDSKDPTVIITELGYEKNLNKINDNKTILDNIKNNTKLNNKNNKLIPDTLNEIYGNIKNIYDQIKSVFEVDNSTILNNNNGIAIKYVTYETGEFFTDEVDIKPALTNLLNKQYKISPKKWWAEHYSQEKSQRELRDFIVKNNPNVLPLDVKKVKFIL
jgi:hypothetical protein